MPINSVLCASATFIAALVCFDVLELEPRTTNGSLGAASPVRKIDPVTGKIIAIIKV